MRFISLENTFNKYSQLCTSFVAFCIYISFHFTPLIMCTQHISLTFDPFIMFTTSHVALGTDMSREC